MIEAGVPLFDDLSSQNMIWVFYPTERLDGGGWRCDIMTLYDGELIECWQGLCFSERFLATLYESPPK